MSTPHSRTGEDQFKVRELLSTITDIPQFVSTKGQVSSQTIEKNTGQQHLAPPFDDVIHVIRHSSFRVGSEQQTSVVSTENMEFDVRSVSPGLRNGYVETATMKPTASESNQAAKDVKPDQVELRSDLSEVSVGPKEESTSPSHKETLDVNSSRQRADALEGLLELSAELLQHNRLEELSVVLKPFGKDKVSPRETAIWLAKSFKGMMSEEASRSAA